MPRKLSGLRLNTTAMARAGESAGLPAVAGLYSEASMSTRRHHQGALGRQPETADGGNRRRQRRVPGGRAIFWAGANSSSGGEAAREQQRQPPGKQTDQTDVQP